MKIYTYSKCSTCGKAVKWLRERGVSFTEVPIRERPPTKTELRRMLAVYGGDLRKLFNTSGGDYRELKIGTRLPTMSRDEAIDLLASNGNLVKRPFLLDGDRGLVGFKEPEWEAFFG